MMVYGEKMVKRFFIPLIRWRAFLTELKNAWPVGLMFSGLALALGVGWLLSPTLSGAVRYAGMFLQGFGLLTVAIGLSKARQLFGHSSMVTWVLAWFGRLAETFRPPKPITLQTSAGSMVTMGGDASLTHSTGPGASVDQRLSILEQNVSRLQGELDTKIHEIRGQLGDMKEKIQRESLERLTDIQKITQMIEEVAIGGLHLQTLEK